MKKLVVIAIALASLLAISCSKDETPAPTPETTPTPDEKPLKELMFVGTLKSIDAEGKVFTQANKVEFEVITTVADTATLWMYGPQFANKMPPGLNMEVAGITSKSNETSTTLTGVRLTPYIKDKPYPSFIITELTATISENDTKMVVAFKCMGHSVIYTGDIKK